MKEDEDKKTGWEKFDSWLSPLSHRTVLHERDKIKDSIWDVSTVPLILIFMLLLFLFSYLYFGHALGLFIHSRNVTANSSEARVYGYIYALPVGLFSYLLCVGLNYIRKKIS